MKCRSFVALLVTSVTLLLCGCGADPKKVQITEQNKDSLLTEMKDMKGLTVEEVGLLIGAQITSGVRKAFGGEQRKIVGKTVGELLVELKQEATEQKTENQRQEKLAAEAKAKEDALMAELRKSISLTVVNKGFMEVNYQSYVTIKVVYKNESIKDIRALRGAIQFTNLFGKEIFLSDITITDGVKAGQQAEWTGQIQYNQFMDKDKNLRFTDLADMKIVWKPAAVIFVDGTTIGA
jgi:hypothetical protein